MPIEGTSEHMGLEQAQMRAALPDIAQSTADSYSATVETNTHLKDVKISLEDQSKGITSLVSSFKKFFAWNKKHSAAMNAANALKDSISPPKDDKEGKKKPGKKEVDYSGVNLPKLALLAAGALGVVRGLFIGIAKTVRAWATLFVPNIVDSWDEFGKSIDNFVKDVKTSLGKTKTSLTNQWAKMMGGMSRFFAKQFAIVKTFFSVAEDGKIAKLMKGIARRFKGFTTMLSDVGDLLKSLWQNTIGRIISRVKSSGKLIMDIMSKFGKFGALVRVIGSIVGKLFVPLTVIMTAFDTINGIIEGYKKDGIWGAIEGGINALFKSIIFMPLDLLTDGVEWLLRQMGFDDEADMLKGFSWSKLWDDVVGEIFANIRKLVDSLFNIFAVATDPDKTWTDVLFAGLKYVKNWWDILFYPYKAALKWLMKKFVWSKSEAERKSDFQFTDLVWDLVKKGRDWLLKKIDKFWEDIKTTFGDAFKVLTDMLPSMETIKQIAWDNMPDYAKPFAPESMLPMSEKTAAIREKIAKVEKQLEEYNASDANITLNSTGENMRKVYTQTLEDLRKQLNSLLESATGGSGGGDIINITNNNNNTTGTSIGMLTGSGRPSPNPVGGWRVR